MAGTLKLTIAIPTYNRNEILLCNLRKLIPQLGANYELLIIDNCSDIPVVESMNAIAEWRDFSNIRVIRNIANVGGNENILRCIEHSSGDYVWLLGDDDVPCVDAVKSVIDEIEANTDADIINMRGIAPSHKIRDITHRSIGAIGYLNSAEFLGELMFISSMVFKKASVMPNLSIAHLNQSTFAPQLIMALLTLGVSGVSVISKKIVVHAGGETTPKKLQYPSIYVSIGIAGLMDYGWNDQVYKRIVLHLVNIRRIWMTPYGLVNQLLQISKSGNSGKALSLRMHKTIRNRLYGIGNPLNKERLLFYAGWIVIAFPSFGNIVKNFMWSILKKEKLVEEDEANVGRL